MKDSLSAPPVTVRREAPDPDAHLIGALRLLFHPEEHGMVRQRIASLPESEQLALLRRAQIQEIGPLVARQLAGMEGLSHRAIAIARRIYRDNLARNLYLRSETEQWIELLAESGVPCRPLKGAGASPLLYGDLGARACTDIDLLVRPQDLAAAKSLAACRGFKEEAKSAFPDPDLKAVHLWPVENGATYSVDLHWRIESPRLVPIDHADFWRPPPEGRRDGGETPSLALPLDLIGVVLCLHLWRHAVTLKTLVDFAAFVRRFDEQIPAVRRRLRQAGAQAGLDLALVLSFRVLGVGSRFMPGRTPRELVLPWLRHCLRKPFAARGLYFGWLVFPLQLDGTVRPLGRLAAHLLRPSARDGRLRVGSRVARLSRVAARAALSAARFGAGPGGEHAPSPGRSGIEQRRNHSS